MEEEEETPAPKPGSRMALQPIESKTHLTYTHSRICFSYRGHACDIMVKPGSYHALKKTTQGRNVGLSINILHRGYECAAYSLFFF